MLSQRPGATTAARVTLAAITLVAVGVLALNFGWSTSGPAASVRTLPGDRDCPSGSCSDPSNSFNPDTLVRMADGSVRRIDSIAAGDTVATLDGSQRVLAVIRGTGIKDLVEINASLIATANHLLHTDRGWIAAGELVLGDVLLGTGTPVAVVALHADTSYATVVNLDVTGQGAYLVHVDGADVAVHE